MPNKMLIDATHPEETRVVVLRGNRVEEFDFESASRKQLRGNIYLAKVTRVEPSLQAAFVDYGGNRHGFLAFSEIHPDYYQIPVADRQALIDEESRAQRDADEDDERGGRRRQRHRQRGADRKRNVVRSDAPESDEPARDAADAGDASHPDNAPSESSDSSEDWGNTPAIADAHETALEASAPSDAEPVDTETPAPAEEYFGSEVVQPEQPHGEPPSEPSEEMAALDAAASQDEPEDRSPSNGHSDEDAGDDSHPEEDAVESIGGDQDAMEEMPERTPRYRRQYKIQEVIKRRQVMLVQVVKEERGTKGAALTTYLSLAGRYSVLMPNTARGGGISRKITSPEDRRRLKEVAEELEVPEGMGVILRTAGASRTKTEVKRDFEYLLRVWETVRDLTLKSTAPKLVYEEGSLVKRSIRDLYHKDIDEIIVEGDGAYQEAKEFMRMLMPSHAKNVKLYRNGQPVFARFGIEAQLDAMFQPTVQLKSGGYIVLNQTEALVAIDVNSGRATREHNIEDTALKTNTEAAAEIARQLRLRDLAGLIVIDFIDMEENRNNRSVERKLKEALKSDRARIQVGRISHFGLMEMSRQRIRASVLESSTDTCPHCGGSGHVRSVASVSLQLIRALEEMLLKGGTHNLIARTRSDIALYVLNHKRAHLRALEERFRILIAVNADATVTGHPPFAIDRGEQVMTLEQAKALLVQSETDAAEIAEEEDVEQDSVEDVEDLEETEISGEEDEESADSEAEAQPQEADEPRDQGEAGRRRRRGRRGRGRGREHREGHEGPAASHGRTEAAATDELASEPDGEEAEEAGQNFGEPGQARQGEEQGNGEKRRRRRGRRGGRRNRRDRADGNGSQQPPEREGAQDFYASEPDTTPAPRDDVPLRHDEAPQEIASRTSASMAEPVEQQQETPRRRSTIREPAPRWDDTGEFTQPIAPAAPAADEIAPSPAPSDEPKTQPRRFGWWSRKG